MGTGRVILASAHVHRQATKARRATTMVNAIQLKAFEIVARLRDMKEERGQTSAEYVAVTAVAVAIAIGVIYAVLQTALTTAVSDIGSAITDFVDTNL